jgi:hypothetical protein
VVGDAVAAVMGVAKPFMPSAACGGTLMNMTGRYTKPALTIFLLSSLALLASCGDWRLFTSRETSPLRITSDTGSADFAPALRTIVYRSADSSSAEIYLTDLPLQRLTDLDDTLGDVSGTIIHIVIFLQPRAGRTPIDNTACNASIRQIILSGPERGVFGGGGFVVPSGLGEATMSASVSGATLRLTGKTAGFVDALGPSRVAGSFTAVNDQEQTRLLAQRLVQILASVKDVPTK